MTLLSKEDLSRLQADMADLLRKYNMTSAYAVIEHQDASNGNGRPRGDYCAVVMATVEEIMPTAFLSEMAEQTFSIIRSVSKVVPTINDN